MKYLGLYNIVSWEDMIRLIEEAEGNPSRKRELLQEMHRRRELLKKKIANSNNLSITTRTDKSIADFDGYEDYEERLRIFKKRLAILLQPDENNDK
ncbi:MAG: hypothetical protein ACXAC8_17845 [Candidatus Hodarchaeales archaeon]|jgi:ABC-type Fe3+-hydroxamate transport system substrate-binding protein